MKKVVMGCALMMVSSACMANAQFCTAASIFLGKDKKIVMKHKENLMNDVLNKHPASDTLEMSGYLTGYKVSELNALVKSGELSSEQLAKVYRETCNEDI